MPNSVLDERGDVVLFRDPTDGTRWLFRDGYTAGLILTWDRDSGRWSVARPGGPVLAHGGRTAARLYEATSARTGRVLIRHDTQYGLMARVARRFLPSRPG